MRLDQSSSTISEYRYIDHRTRTTLLSRATLEVLWANWFAQDNEQIMNDSLVKVG